MRDRTEDESLEPEYWRVIDEMIAAMGPEEMERSPSATLSIDGRASRVRSLFTPRPPHKLRLGRPHRKTVVETIEAWFSAA